MRNALNDTIAAICTPPGEGGVALLRLSGKDAIPITCRIFEARRGGSPEQWKGYTVRYGVFRDPRTGEVVDDGLLLLFRNPHSYTGEDVVELSCHGGRAVTAKLLEILFWAGARSAEPGEFTQRAFLNGRMDLAQAEAVADLIHASTEAARKVARRQLEGSLSRRVTEIKDDLIGVIAAIEVTIDFSDEVGELEYPPMQTRLDLATKSIETLLLTAERGRILREGLRIAIVGRPNVGKSSLLNALLRFDRAIVTPIAGTTRDLVEESANLAGLPVVLIDTAGIRETQDMVERIGVERAQGAAESADAVLFVIDLTEGWTLADAELTQSLAAREQDRLILVLNKADAVSERETQAQRQSIEGAFPHAVSVSAQTGAGLEQLEAEIVAVALGDAGVLPESVVVANARHRHALETALASLKEAENSTRLRLPGDFITIDVRGALDALGEITGETLAEDIVHRIFRDFCVGK